MTFSKENETTSIDIQKNIHTPEIVLSDAEKQIRQSWLWSLRAVILVTLMSYAVIYYIGFKSAGIEFRVPDGRGARFTEEGTLKGFLQP